MAKASQLDKAIAALKADRAVLDLAIAKLEAQLTAKPAPKATRKRAPLGLTAVSGTGTNQ